MSRAKDLILVCEVDPSKDLPKDEASPGEEAGPLLDKISSHLAAAHLAALAYKKLGLEGLTGSASDTAKEIREFAQEILEIV